MFVKEYEQELQRLRNEIGRLQGLLADEVHRHKITKDRLAEAEYRLEQIEESTEEGINGGREKL